VGCDEIIILQFVFKYLSLSTLLTKNSLNCWVAFYWFVTNMKSIFKEIFSISGKLFLDFFFITCHRVFEFLTDFLIIRSFFP
jgi:hypothetical protein